MNTLLETLYLRRLRLEYVSPPVCPVNFSSSGLGFIDQIFNEDEFCPMGIVGIASNFLNFAQPADGLAYNVYRANSKGAVLSLMASGLPSRFAAVWTSGNYWITANTPSGESLPLTTVYSPGGVYTNLLLPALVAPSYNLYKDGTKIIVGFTGAVVEATQTGWWMATKITTDGESPIVTSCGPVFINIPVPPPPPPPPPPPGPDWPGFTVVTPICLGCLGFLLPFSQTANSGGFTTGADFNVTASIIGQSTMEYTIDEAGEAFGLYTGPAFKSQLVLSVATTGTGTPSGNVGAPPFVQVLQDGNTLLALGGVAGATGPMASGTYGFHGLAGTNSQLKVLVQDSVDGAVGSVVIAGTFQNIT